MEPIRTFTSTLAVLPADDVDTDQIIPARFLTTTVRAGLGRHLFANWRFDAAGESRPDFVLNRPEAAHAQVLVAGRNFGCGSSREHAPWALLDFGFRAVIASSFADIFRGNALKNGLLPIAVDDSFVHRLRALHGATPGARVTIDLPRERVVLGDGEEVAFTIEPFAKHCLINGVDQLGHLVAQSAAIEAYEFTHPSRISTLALEHRR